MSLISRILLAVIILSLVGMALIMPFAICDYFLGRERAEKLLKIFNVNIDGDKLDLIGVALTFIAFIAYIIRDNLS